MDWQKEKKFRNKIVTTVAFFQIFCGLNRRRFGGSYGTVSAVEVNGSLSPVYV